MRILLFTGKGGVGKTTSAAATALRLADRGCKTLLLSTDAAHSVGDALGVELGGEPQVVAPSLWALHMDTQSRLELAWRDVQQYLISLLDRAGVDPVTADELTMLPGIEEVLALLEVRDLALRGDWDVLVVDCGPTAETLRLLALPEALGWYLNKIFPAHRRLARGMRPFAALLGRAEAIPPDALFAALLQLCEELRSVRELLGNPRVTSVRLVLTPESVVVAEARRTFTALSLYGYQVDEVVANRVFPTGAAATRNGWLRGWVEAQRVHLDTLAESFAGVPVRQVPYAAAEPVGTESLRAVADHLYGQLPGTDPSEVGTPVPLMTVERDGEEYVLLMALPLAERGEVQAARSGDDLVLTVASHRRVVTLPSVLRRCSVIGGGFADGRLRVRFQPDPALWPQVDRVGGAA